MQLKDYLLHWESSLNGGIYPDEYASYLSLNLVRFNRITKTFSPSQAFIDLVKDIKKASHWIIITEPWCGDAAQSVPLILKLIEHVPNASYTLELRDQGTLIDHYLTNGGKAIPKLICINEETGEELGLWGPRPQHIQFQVDALKAEGPEAFKAKFGKMLHVWYGKDKGKSVQEEFTQSIKSWNK